MSQQAEIARSERRHWAAAGGAHDRVVRLMQLGLPAAVGALAAVMLLAPFGNHGEISFLVAKDKIEVAQQRMMVNNALYRGSDSNGRPFQLSANNAVQRSSADPVVRMQGLTASINLADGPAQLVAPSGDYNPTSDQVDVHGPLNFTAADGYRLSTGNVRIDLKARTLRSDQPVTGSTRIGSFSGNSIQADMESRTVRLTGRARMRLNQGMN